MLLFLNVEISKLFVLNLLFLEFLSYKLRLIDPSQIKDHEVYYNKTMLENALQGTGWKLDFYKRFQFGMNSFFQLKKTNSASTKV